MGLNPSNAGYLSWVTFGLCLFAGLNINIRENVHFVKLFLIDSGSWKAIETFTLMAIYKMCHDSLKKSLPTPSTGKNL